MKTHLQFTQATLNSKIAKEFSFNVKQKIKTLSKKTKFFVSVRLDTGVQQGTFQATGQGRHRFGSLQHVGYCNLIFAGGDRFASG